MSERIEPGMFALDSADPRVVRGLLLPYGVASGQPLAGEAGTMFAAGDVVVPGDPSIVTLNREHNRFDPVGRAVELVDEPGVGVLAAFRYAETPEGDAELEAYAGGKRRQLSPEIAKYVDAAGNVVRRVLVGAGLVGAGAFAGAQLFSVSELDAGALDPRTAATIDELVVARQRVAELEAELAPKPDEASVPVITDASSINPEPPAGVASAPVGDSADHAAHAADEPPAGELDETGDEPENGAHSMGDINAPATLGTGTPAADERKLTKGDLFAAIADNTRMGTPIPEAFAAAGELFAWGTAVGSQANVIATPQILGEVWDGIGFTPKYSGLVAHGDLSALVVKGWKFGTRPTVSAWAGDGAAVDGAAVTTSPLSANANRIAGGNGIPREYIDFGETQFVDAIVRLLAEDYARDVDAAVGAALVAGATALASPATTALAMIIDGAIAIVNNEDTPAFALVNPADFATIANTKEVDKLAYIEISIDWGGGNVHGLRVVPSSLVTTGASLQVLVGSKNALRLFELPGSPIRVDAAAIQNGRTDEAVFGYYTTLLERSASLQLVS
jgi:hypothetical protein